MTVQHPSASTKLYVGIDAGSVSLNGMVIDEKKQILYDSPYVRHMGTVKENVIALIRELYKRFGQESVVCIAFTGNHGKKLSERLGTFYEFENISQGLGALHIQPDVRTVMSMGGQDTALAQIERNRLGHAGPCSSMHGQHSPTYLQL